MDTYIVFVYCLCDDLLKALRHWEDPQCEVKDAEILTAALVAARYFGGNLAWAQAFLFEQRYFTRRLSPSRFSMCWISSIGLLVPFRHNTTKSSA